MKRICLLVVIILIVGNWVKSQPNLDTYTNVIPPSPTASSLGTYGQVPVGMFTGTAQFNIPIYEVKSSRLSVPISLNYATNGVKVDQIESWVGLGWSLNAGGVITRTVRDRADEESSRLSFENILSIEDFSNDLLAEIIMDEDNSEVDTEPDIYSYNFNGNSGKFIIGLDGNPILIPHRDIKIEITQNSSSFFRSFVITTNDGVKYYFGMTENGEFVSSAVERTTSQSSCAEGREGQASYYTSWYLTSIEHPTGEKINFNYTYYTSNYKSGIYQNYTKTTTPFLNCEQCPNLENSNFCATELTLDGVLLTSISSVSTLIEFDASPRTGNGEYQLDVIRVKDKITSSVVKEFHFNYLLSNNTSGTNFISPQQTSRLFLEELNEVVPGVSETKTHSFEYNDINQLPVRLSCDQDHWGYYNGADNGAKFMPVNTSLNYIFGSSLTADREPNSQTSKYGTLKKISYPTGGTSEIDYEQHQYLGEVHEYQPSDMEYYSESIVGLLNEHEDTLNETVNIQYGQEYITFTATLECITTNGSTSDNGEGSVQVNLGSKTVFSFSPAFDESTDITAGQKLTLTKKVFAGDIGIPSSGFKGNFNIALEAVDEEFEMKLSFSYVKSPPSETLVEKNIDTGGVRVKRITTKESDDSEEQIVRYYYGDLDDINKSSATTPIIPDYLDETSQEIDCNEPYSGGGGFHMPDYEYCDLKQLSSNSNLNLYNQNGSHIAYNNVIKSHGEYFENGGEYFSYIANVDQKGWVQIGNEVIAGTSYSNDSWNSGMLKGTGKFKLDSNGNPVILQKEAYTYNYETEFNTSNDSRNALTITAGVIKRIKTPHNFNPANKIYFTCDESNVNSRYLYGETCTTDHKHWLVSHNRYYRCGRVFTRNLEPLYIHHPCYGQDPDANSPVEIVQWPLIGEYTINMYNIYSRWPYLKSKVTTVYDSEGGSPVFNTQSYEYGDNDILHTNLTKSTFEDSDGDIIVNRLYYPLDYDEDHPDLSTITSKYMTGLLIDSRKEVGGKLVSGQLLHYNDVGQVEMVYNAENELGSALNFDESNPYAYGTKKLTMSYDAVNGNTLEVLKEDNEKVSIIWSLDALYPVVNAESIDHATLESGVTLAMDFVSGYSDFNNFMESTIGKMHGGAGNLRSKWNDFNVALRDQLSNTLITTYTYDPLIGMTSQTDPAGITTYYEYDAFGRLEYIKDEDGNVLKHYQYHYAGAE